MEEDPIAVGAEDGLAVIAAHPDMRGNPGGADSWKSSHAAINAPGRGGARRKILNRFNWSLTPFIFLAGCSLIDPYNMIGRQGGETSHVPTEVVPPPVNEYLGPEQRARAFDFVWGTVAERYHDPKLNGVDWKAVGERYRPLVIEAKDEAAVWENLDRMTGELRDAHTRVESPERVAMRKRDESISLGFSFMPLEGKLAITGVNTDSDAWWAGVRSGMTLVEIGGEPAAKVYERLLAEARYDSTERSRHFRAIRRLLTGAEGSKVAFTFERADGSQFPATVARRKFTSRAATTSRVLPSGLGYLRLTQWTVGVRSRMLAALDEVREAPALIIDLRGNPGGAVQTVDRLLAEFFERPTELGRTTTRTGQPISMLFGAVEIIKLKSAVEGNPRAYKKPVAILVNSQSASASELFSGTMQATGRAIVVGQPTCGCLLGFLGYARIPGGGELAYSEVGFVLTNGKRIEGEGVMPDHVVPLSLGDLVVGRDRVLETAEILLKKSIPDGGSKRGA
jgi:carboxyl-terminal processing protease